MDSKRFIECVTDTLMAENERRIGTDKYLLDVAFMVAPVEQHIGESQYTSMLSSLSDECQMYYRDNTDEYNANGELSFNGSSDDPDKVVQYILTFFYDERMHGYCFCEPTNEGYSTKHRCCGNGCDWNAPAFYIDRVESVGSDKWTGVERDYWRYEAVMNARLAERSTDVNRERKTRESEWLRNEIARLTGQLNDLHV